MPKLEFDKIQIAHNQQKRNTLEVGRKEIIEAKGFKKE